MRILIVTDAWFPQVNGVVRTPSTLSAELDKLGHRVRFVTSDGFRTVRCPTYPEIRLALFGRRGVADAFAASAPDAAHIATEGPLGWAARRYCLAQGLPFTTSFHTRFPEYVQARTRIPPAWSYALQRRFHGAGAGMMVATESVRRQLAARGFTNIRAWTWGVDAELFRPVPAGQADHEAPIATLSAFDIDPAACRAHALRYSWPARARMFLGNLAPFGAVRAAA